MSNRSLTRRAFAGLAATGALAALLLGTSAIAAELPLQPVEIENLGIEFRAPEPVDAATTIPARARVIVPPAADYAVSAAVPGLVERVFVGVGDSVGAGQPLLAIRSPEFLSLQQQYLDFSVARDFRGELGGQTNSHIVQLRIPGQIQKRFD